MSYAGLGQTAAPMLVSIEAGTAQGLANRGAVYNGVGTPLIVVDHHAGPITIAALRALSHQFADDQPVTNIPATTRITSRVSMPNNLVQRLMALPAVAPPPAAAVTQHAVPAPTAPATPATPSTPSTPAGTAVVSVAPTVPGQSPVIADEGSTSGFHMPMWGWGAIALGVVGAGAIYMSSGKSAPKKPAVTLAMNRRRARRNRRRSRR